MKDNDDDATVRWTIFVPKKTDVSLRTHLAQAGLKRGSLSKFVAEAVAWRLFDLNVAASKAHNKHVPSDVIEDEIEQALSQVRAARFAKRA
jgi:ribbon-helix-helix protein